MKTGGAVAVDPGIVEYVIKRKVLDGGRNH